MLGTRLNELIRALGIKKGEFARRIGFSQAYISMILRGKKQNPSARFMDSVCREFHVNPLWLETGEGPLFQEPDASFSSADQNLLSKYHSLPLDQRQVIDEIVDAMVLKNFAAAQTEEWDSMGKYAK